MKGLGLIDTAMIQEEKQDNDDLSFFISWQAKEIVDSCAVFIKKIHSLSIMERIETLNELRRMLHDESPFYGEPVDCVQWIHGEQLYANDYNPNTVAPPEMKLLERSIIEDGYTQPIVAWIKEKRFEVIDGFHRSRVGKESIEIKNRIHGYLPVTVVNEHRLDRGDRIASTIRHNRARGKHRVEAMSDIVVELKRRNWTDERICRELGMDQDEVLRLCQITGLAELFSDQEFSKSWDVEGNVSEIDFEELSDDSLTYGDEVSSFRTVNTSDETRIFHTYEKWECYKSGFYAHTKDGMTKTQCEEAYRDFLLDIPRFTQALECVVIEWKYSCEHYLTNSAMNRIAWLGQASVCYALGIPSIFRSGFWLLTEEQQKKANEAALIYLNKWMMANGRESVTMEVAYSGERQMEIY
jgi:ParB-like chromosome segregation protein Spo0J